MANLISEIDCIEKLANDYVVCIYPKYADYICNVRKNGQDIYLYIKRSNINKKYRSFK